MNDHDTKATRRALLARLGFTNVGYAGSERAYYADYEGERVRIEFSTQR